jgi:hypothetical protein
MIMTVVVYSAIVILFTVTFMSALFLHTVYERKKEIYVLEMDIVPPNWNRGGHIDIIVEDGGIEFEVLDILDDTHILVKRVK